MNPVISVVMPVYNGELFVGEQLQALASQDFDHPWELVVADNGSTDGSAAIIDNYRDRLSITIVDASAVKGVSYARSLGAERASAALVAYCDADDVVNPQWLNALHRGWLPGTVVAGALEYDLLNSPAHIKPRGRLQSDRLPVLLNFLPTAAGCNFLIERAVLREVGGWRLDLKHGEDTELTWRLQLAGHPLVFAPDAVVHYRLRGNAKSVFRQIYWYNDSFTWLFKEHQSAGARRRTPQQVARGYVWVLTRSPYLMLGVKRRYLWCALAGENAGRLAGSIRYRTFCL